MIVVIRLLFFILALILATTQPSATDRMNTRKTTSMENTSGPTMLPTLSGAAMMYMIIVGISTTAEYMRPVRNTPMSLDIRM